MSEDDDTMHGTAYPQTAGLMTPEGASGDFSLEGESEDEWPVRGPAKGIRLALPTAGIIVVLLVAAGFWGGAAIEKNHGSSGTSAAASLASRFRSAQTAAAGAAPSGTGARSSTAGGFPGGFGGASSSAATGTVSVVDGNTLYILTSAGSLVKVTLGASTTITRNSTTQADGLRPGDTVVVQGATAKKTGDVTATSISATAAGVSAAG